MRKQASGTFYRKVIALGFVFFVLLPCFYWNFAYLRKLFMAGEVLYRDDYTPETFITASKKLLTYHPEIRQDTFPLAIYRGVQNVFRKFPERTQDVRFMISELEGYSPKNPYAYVNIGRTYLYLTLQEGRIEDYSSAAWFFEKALQIMPDNPLALYNLHCLYGLSNEGYKKIEIERRIEKNSKINPNWTKSSETCNITTVL